MHTKAGMHTCMYVSITVANFKIIANVSVCKLSVLMQTISAHACGKHPV